MATRYDILSREVFGDAETLAKHFCHDKDFVWLDSARGGSFSLMAWQASEVVSFNRADSPERFLQFLKSVQVNDASQIPSPWPFVSGWIGWMNYEAALLTGVLPENLSDKLKHPLSLSQPLAFFAFYDTAIYIDVKTGRMFFLSSSPDAEKIWRDVSSRLAKTPPTVQVPRVGEIKSWLAHPDYLDILEQIHQDIGNGRYYEINFSQVFSTDVSGSALEIYLALRRTCPAAMMAFINTPGGNILSASPECFFHLKGRDIATFPIKGTRPLTPGASQDLLKDSKERAELLMITDLMRSDLGRFCEPGSVRVLGYPILESHAHYHHLHSHISGRARESCGLDEVFSSLLPGGSITGAPKIEAMRAIAQYENRARGIYTGAVGFISSSGVSEFNIAIRTLEITGDHLLFATGGGIVYDSDPEREYEECLVKAAGIFQALGIFGAGFLGGMRRF